MFAVEVKVLGALTTIEKSLPKSPAKVTLSEIETDLPPDAEMPDKSADAEFSRLVTATEPSPVIVCPLTAAADAVSVLSV